MNKEDLVFIEISIEDLKEIFKRIPKIKLEGMRIYFERGVKE